MTLEKMTAIAHQMQPIVLSLGLKIAIALTLFLAGRFCAKFAKHLLKKAMTKAQIDPTLTSFASNLLLYSIMAVVVLAALSAVGIETTSLIAIIGAAGLAIGLALQGSLTNFAAGIIIIIFRPLRVGDWIEVSRHSGIVTDIQLLTTTLHSLDNRTIVVPNSDLTSDSLVNYSTLGQLRLDLVIGVSYATDIDRVKAILMDVITAEPRVLTEPAPVVGLLDMADSSLDFAVRPWCETQHYLPLQMALQENIKKRLDQEGISIPFPQRDVHLFAVNGTSNSETLPAMPSHKRSLF